MSWQDREPWTPEPVVVAPVRDPVGTGPDAVIAALRDLGVLKPAEQPRALHVRSCPFVKDRCAPCQCPGGPEIMWPDWDETTPVRHYITPPRFYGR